ncbi:MAG: gluconate permease [Verrucomicrobiales bacterium]|nr:gluconate permease [Verrucomicrobiales bacterium]
MDNPFVILLIGIAVVIGMIIGLRINAFIALITAAIVVSLLSPGVGIANKISDVAAAFGKTAGGIGIVIALAAVIGKCLMDSGAADRIVRAFVRALGEKGSSSALAGSGFVLSIPVFFDTVFYLLVPLARSLYRSTKKNYLKYILAISAGAAVTHTLVPPTPGPLLMAQQLGVDLGMMIGIGAAIGLPAAIAGLCFAKWLDRKMPIEMRALPGEDETTEAVPDSKLPGLFVSLLPIILPVALIGTNTALETRANGERAAQVKAEDVKDWGALSAAVSGAQEGPLKTLAGFAAEIPANPTDEQKAAAVAAINKALTDREQFDTGASLARANLAIVEHENRKVLESALPETVLAPHVWDTAKRTAANTSKFYGNANFALLLSAVIAVLLYVRQCKPTKSKFSETIESALMSGGLIILITSAGGAFGAALAAAKIGPAIQDMFPTESNTVGIGLLVLAFAISALLKIAQGSTTVAVITASGMIAAMLEGMTLPYHPVYLATAIGGGGLIGSWMNDSGFWIFSKMSGLTEAEALKSWTPLLCVLGLVTFAMSILLSLVLPLAQA